MALTDHMMCFKEESSVISSSENASSSPAKEVYKCDHRLVDYDSLPDFMKHNEFILSYYRSEWPMKQTILSVFAIHNETLNIWTHLIGFFIFLALTTFTAMMVPTYQTETILPSTALQQHSSMMVPSTLINIYDLHHESFIILPSYQANHTGRAAAEPEVAVVQMQPQVARWPFYAYLCGAMFCLLMSSACHLLSCHSEHTCYVMLRLDYAGISALIVTSFYPVVYYSFACDPFFRNLYIAFITVFGIATVLVSLVPVFEKPEFRIVRALLFAGMGISGLVPIVHKLVAFGDRPEAVLTAGYEVVMGAFYGLGVVVYAARIPERWMLGRFDLAGHSHQLFDVLVIAGAYTHYLAGLVYLSWREMETC